MCLWHLCGVTSRLIVKCPEKNAPGVFLISYGNAESSLKFLNDNIIWVAARCLSFGSQQVSFGILSLRPITERTTFPHAPNGTAFSSFLLFFCLQRTRTPRRQRFCWPSPWQPPEVDSHRWCRSAARRARKSVRQGQRVNVLRSVKSQVIIDRVILWFRPRLSSCKTAYATSRVEQAQDS